MLSRFQALPLMLVVLAPFYMGADTACVETPRRDTLVATSTVQIQGVLQDENGNQVDGQVQVRVNGTPLPPVNTAAGRYMTTVPLAVGANVIDGVTSRMAGTTRIPGTLEPFRIQRRTDLVDRGSQPYFLDFSAPAYQQQVRDFIRLTVNTQLSAARLDALLAQVNERVRVRFRAAYEQNGLRVVQVNAAGTGVSRVFFEGSDPNQPFGLAPLDFRNQNKQQTGTVFMASIRRSFVDNQQLFLATPARRTDTPEQRAIDLGNILSKAGVHELAHTLGLVASGPQLLDGCDGAHNCPAFDDANPLANRFQLGAFFMDARRSAAADFGSSSATMRIEMLPVFNSFNFGYLDIIH